MSRRLKIALAALAFVVSAATPLHGERVPLNKKQRPTAGFSWGMPLR
ncbi:hypothetical protein [Micromonospora craniellae]|nr:hypothetical protein [Micromonospora craniellae]QOC93346.1 hypothetical protein ID554_06635 [Micromonospora craniellae]